jgi:diguanylate cyclase (GGDEF)-like protein/PAS domain S-box-containing protein
MLDSLDGNPIAEPSTTSAEIVLQQRLAIQQLIVRISTHLIKLAPEQTLEGIDWAIAQIGEFLGADRCYALLLAENNAQIAYAREWRSPEIELQLDSIKNLSWEDFAAIANPNLQPIYFPTTDNVEQVFWRSPFLKSAVLIPVYSPEVLVGVLGCDFVRETKIWTEEETMLLQVVGEVLATSLQRATETKALLESATNFRLLVQSIKDYAIYMLDPKGYVISWNAGAERINGYKETEIIGKHFSCFYPQEDIQRGKPNRVLKIATVEGRFEDETWRMRKDRSKFWASVIVTALKDKNGRLKGFAKVTRDITERKLAEERLIHNAFHDVLTGLPNKALFVERLNHEVRHARRHQDYLFAVLFLDIDRFKIVNESLGYSVGDRLLKSIAHRLEACLDTTSIVARFGGDAFTVLLENIKDINNVIRITSKVQQQLSLPFQIDEHEIFITTSIGIAANTFKLVDPEDLLRDAEIAMFRAKTQGKARYEVFNASARARAVTQLQRENELRRAIEREELRLFYQPIITLSNRQIVGFEALVRWQHPQRGWITPSEFIPLAEETDLILPLDLWVLETACRQMKDWQQQFPERIGLTMSVNLSGKQFSQPNLRSRLETVLTQTGLAGRYLKLEITEGALIEHPDTAAAILEQLRSQQIQLCIDDFGTGYCSLNYLHRFPLNMLKIDRSFVSCLGVEQARSAIVQTIIALAHNLGMEVVAEGIETAEQLAQLRALKCEFGQGYLFSKPVNTETATALIRDFPQL